MISLSTIGCIAKPTGSGPPSAASFTSGHPYKSGRDGWVYKCEGYDDNSNLYPLIIFGHGYGERGTDVNLVLDTGAPFYIAAGDRPANVLYFCPQYPSGDWTEDDWDQALAYMVANYRIDTNRVYITGLSGGAFWCGLIARNRTADIAGTVVAAGTLGSGWDWNAQADIAHFWVHGTTDGTVTIPLQSLLNQANAVPRLLPFNTLALWGIGHTDVVWNTNVYNRKDRTDAPGTATFDYVRYLCKQSKDPVQRATLHVANAQETLEIDDYRDSLNVVNSLSAGPDKTALLAQLAALKTTINAGGRFFIVDPGATAPVMPNVNQMTSAQTGQSITNLVDDDGGASSYSYGINSQYSTTPTSRMNDVGTRADGPYFGVGGSIYKDGLRLEATVSTGDSGFKNLNPAKTYKIRIYHTFAAGNFTAKSEITVTIGGVTKTMYSECNNSQYLEWDGLSPDGSNNIDIDAGTTDPARNTQISFIQLYEYP